METRIEYLRPREIESAMAACPVLFQPLGTVEWHGRQNIAGLDALKAHALCMRAAERAGALVAPPLYGGVGGLDEPCTFVIEPENNLYSVLLRPWLEALCRETVRQGFKAMIILTGHYGAGQQIIVRETAARMTRILGRPILGTPEYFLALPEGYTGDHAAYFETSLMMYLYPDSVDLSQLGDPPHQGVHGKDPKKYANAEDGKRFAEAIIGRLATLAQHMPTWDAPTIERFATAEQALVSRQLALSATNNNIWTAWRNLDKKEIAAYPDHLVNERFDEIIALTKTL